MQGVQGPGRKKKKKKAPYWFSISKSQTSTSAPGLVRQLTMASLQEVIMVTYNVPSQDGPSSSFFLRVCLCPALIPLTECNKNFSQSLNTLYFLTLTSSSFPPTPVRMRSHFCNLPIRISVLCFFWTLSPELCNMCSDQLGPKWHKLCLLTKLCTNQNSQDQLAENISSRRNCQVN